MIDSFIIFMKLELLEDGIEEWKSTATLFWEVLWEKGFKKKQL